MLYTKDSKEIQQSQLFYVCAMKGCVYVDLDQVLEKINYSVKNYT